MAKISKKKEFAEGVRRHFQQLAPQLDAELAAITVKPWADTTRFLLIEYDSPHFGEEFAVSLWAMDADGDPADPQRHQFLQGKTVTVPPEIYDAEKYEAIDPWSMASKLLEEWFAERWSASGSKGLPAYMGHHDSYFKINLPTGETVNWDSIVESAKTGSLASPRES